MTAWEERENPCSGLRIIGLVVLLLYSWADSTAQSGSNNVDNNAMTGTIPFAGKSVRCVAISPDGRTLAIGGTANKKRSLLVLWDIQARKEVSRCEMDAPTLTGISFSADGRRLLAVPGNAQSIVIYDTKAGQVERKLSSGADAEILGAVFSKDGDRIAVACSDKKLLIFEVAGGRLVKSVMLSNRSLHIVSNPKEAVFAITLGNKIGIWDFRAAAVRMEIDLPSAEALPYSIAWSPDGHSLATGGLDGKVRIWDAVSGKLQQEWSHQVGYRAVFCVQFSPDGSLLAARAGQLPKKKDLASAWAMLKAGSPIRLWDLRSGKVLADQEGAWVVPVPSAGNTLRFAPDGRTLVITDPSRRGVVLHDVQKLTATARKSPRKDVRLHPSATTRPSSAGSVPVPR